MQLIENTNGHEWKRISRARLCRIKQCGSICSFLCGLVLLWTNAAYAASIDINCGNVKVGTIDVQLLNGAQVANGGVRGSFTSKVGDTPTLAAAAKACNENHFNWYQIVTADNKPPSTYINGKLTDLTPPYIDPTAGGYANGFWNDNQPWYWDETVWPSDTLKPTRTSYLLKENTTIDTLKYEDFPSDFNGTTLSFKTWLVSVDANGKFDSWHEGFSWKWSNSSGKGVSSDLEPLGVGVFPTAAQYTDILAGSGFAVPEPPSLILLAAALAGVFGLAQKRNTCLLRVQLSARFERAFRNLWHS